MIAGRGGSSTPNESVQVVYPPALLAVTVYVIDENCVNGVPVISPFSELIDTPY